jgi:hypothetical protein
MQKREFLENMMHSLNVQDITLGTTNRLKGLLSVLFEVPRAIVIIRTLT